MMIHDIDLIASWVKSPIQKVQAKGWKYLSPSDDVAKALLTFENGTIASVTANRFSSEKRRSTVVYQNNNQISIDFLNKKVEIIKQGETVPFMPQIVESNAIKEELTAFVNSITLNHPVAVPLTEGIQSMDIAFQIIEQINNR
jgi:predicted dehydrogenase